jgi:Domain of unknown function (DUF1814).
MGLTLRALDSVSHDGNTPLWTFGGGTSLAIDLNHRVSYDIDAFLDSAKVIQTLVPVKNVVTRLICWNNEQNRADFQYPGHYLKLIVRNKGEIDFLSTSPLTEDAIVPFSFHGRHIDRERPAEIIAKKIYYRGSQFKARDIFDLACTYAQMPTEIDIAANSPFMSADVYSRTRLRIEQRVDQFRKEIAVEVNPTKLGNAYMKDACDLALEALDAMELGKSPIP